MMGETLEERLVLLVRGSLKRRRDQILAFELLAELAWTRATGRRHEIALFAQRRPAK